MLNDSRQGQSCSDAGACGWDGVVMSSVCPCCGQIVPYGTDFAGNVYVDSTTTDSTGDFAAIISSTGRVITTTLKESAVDEIKEQPYFRKGK